jgi:4-amino-4-deoxy-L-arabinose transferase-like glycosyltransferase
MGPIDEGVGRISQPVKRWPQTWGASLWSPGGFAVLLGLYVGVHVAVRLLASSTLNADDAREAVLAQTLAWGYQARQPPLYDWMVWLAFRLFGVSLATLTLLKYAVLSLAYGSVYAAGRRMLGDARLATLAAFSLILLLPIGWLIHEDLTHSVTALAAGAGTLYLVTRLEASGTVVTYLALGATIGLGILSKFTYLLFVVVLLLTGLTVERLRRRILHPRMMLGLGLAAVLITPFAIWLWSHRSELLLLYVTRIREDRGQSYWRAAAHGVDVVLRTTLYYVTPLGLVVLAVFPGAYRRRRDGPVPPSETGRLVGRFLLAVVVLLVIVALAGNAFEYLKYRLLIPVLFPLPLYLFSRVAETPYGEGRLRRYAACLLAAEILIISGFSLRVRSGSLLGRPYELNLPYDVVASRLKEAGFEGGTAVVGAGRLPGNLRLRFPGARVISHEYPSYIPSPAAAGPCLIIWELEDPAAPPPDLRALLDRALDAHLTGGEIAHTIEAPYRFAPGHVLQVHYILVEEGIGRCR